MCQRKERQEMEQGNAVCMCVCAPWPVTSCWSHMPWWGAPSAVKSTITVVCCVMTALGRLVTALASDRHGRPTVCVCVHASVCKQRESTWPKTFPIPQPLFTYTCTQRLEESARLLNPDALLPPSVRHRRRTAVRRRNGLPTY